MATFTSMMRGSRARPFSAASTSSSARAPPCMHMRQPVATPSRHSMRSQIHTACHAAAWEDASVTLADLKAQLDDALKVEDYSLAARLRDAIQQKQVDGRLAVEDANKRFYDAFMSGDIKRMAAAWGTGEHVQVIHPGSNCIAGREAVMESWRSILAGVRPRAFRIDLEDVRIFATDAYGYVTCVEVVDADDSAGRIAATNIFEKQDGKWVLVFHQGGPAPPITRGPRRRVL